MNAIGANSFLEIFDNTTMPDFVHFHKKMLVLLFKVRNFKVSTIKSGCMKVKSCNRCLNLMHAKYRGFAVPASWSG